MISVAMLTPGLAIGGAERWAATLITHTDPTRIRWTGVVINAFGGRDPAMCREVAAVTDIYSPPVIQTHRGRLTMAGASMGYEPYIRECPDMRAAVEYACRGADILLGWGPYFRDPAVREARTPRWHVHVSHTSEPGRPVATTPHRTCHVAVSEAARNGFGPQGAMAHVLYNGVDVRRLQPREGREAIRDRWGVGPEHYVLGYIGRYAPGKNPAAAAQAIAGLDPRVWRCVYYGAAAAGQQTRSEPILVAALQGRLPNVQCFEHTGDIADVYAGLDVVMLASDAEACSLVLLESWLTRTPIVATLVGSLPVLQAQHGQLCVAVPRRAPTDVLAAAVERAVAIETQEVVARAYTLALQEFTAEAMAARWTSYLEQLQMPTLVQLAL